MASPAVPDRRHPGYAILLVVGGVIGWLASFQLLIERIDTLKDPSYVPSCNISPLVSCGPNMASWQGSVFGFPNPILGVACFVAPIVVGVALLSGARFARWFVALFALGMLAGVSFVGWLISQSVYVLGTLCPYCMVVWSVVIPLFWYTLFFFLAEAGPSGMRPGARAVYPWTWLLVVLSYVVIAVLAQLRLDVVSSLMYGL